MYIVVTKCRECGTEIRRKEVSEESFSMLADGLFSANDRFGDEAGTVGTESITLYRGTCDLCKEELEELEEF